MQCRSALRRNKASSSAEATEDKIPGILRSLRFTSLVFASKKNLRIAILSACHP